MVAFKKLPWVAVDPLDWAGPVSWDDEDFGKADCSSPQYRPSGASAWKRAQRQYQYHGLS